ncbi:hypothetical protein GCM10020331_063000 [Ectobacillus funiculus]
MVRGYFTKTKLLTLGKCIFQVNVDSDSIIVLLQQYGVQEIDLDIGPGMQESIQSLRKEGIAVNAF